MYAGWFANALGKLNPKPVRNETFEETLSDAPKKQKWTRWRALVLRTWAVDPELCPHCHKQMKRAKKALLLEHELQRLLKNLDIGNCPTRPRSPPAPTQAKSQFQIPSSSTTEAKSPKTGIRRMQPSQAQA